MKQEKQRIKIQQWKPQNIFESANLRRPSFKETLIGIIFRKGSCCPSSLLILNKLSAVSCK